MAKDGISLIQIPATASNLSKRTRLGGIFGVRYSGQQRGRGVLRQEFVQ
jgi:hypothetical protein